MDVPSRQEAEGLLQWAAAKNLGPWTAHARTAGRAARTIAAACGMDKERAYALGLLHDIGRYAGVSDMRHIILGHDLMWQQGYKKAALICLTHSFPVQDVETYGGSNDCTPADTLRVQALLEEAVYDDEVRLIQLCDAISLPEGVTIMERRLVDVALRRGVTTRSPEKWRAFLNLKEHFDRMCGRSIYGLFGEEVLRGLL